MNTVWDRNITRMRTFRSKKLEPLAKFFLKIHLTANRMTSIGLFFGFLSAYFLFENHYLFIIFGILHLFADAMDGIIARISTPHKYGEYFDLISDRIVALLFLLKISFYLQDYYAYIVVIIFVITQSVHFFSKLKYQAVYSRSLVFFVLMFNLPVLAYLTAGVISLYSLVLQFTDLLKKIHQ